jgi:hypothetical protein
MWGTANIEEMLLFAANFLFYNVNTDRTGKSGKNS